MVVLLAGILPGQIIPTPQSIEIEDRRDFTIERDTPVVVANDVTPLQRARLAILFDAIGFDLPIIEAGAFDLGDNAVYVGLADRHPAFEERGLRRKLRAMKAPGPQGYRLMVDRKVILLAGSDDAGVVNGLHTLAQIARVNNPVPTLRMRDTPELAVRGVILRGQPDTAALRRLAGYKCNVVLFDSPDFLNGDDERLEEWAATFEDARALGMEPVPMIDPLREAAGLAGRHPDIGQAAMAEERKTLYGDNMAVLDHAPLNAGAVTVTVSGVRCRPGEDYALDEPAMGGAWTLWRVIGGSIPDGATVEVTYPYIPGDAQGVSYAAERTDAVLTESVSRVMEQLAPRYLHLGHDEPLSAAHDARMKQSGRPLRELMTNAIGVMQKAAIDHQEVNFFIWQEALAYLDETALSHDLIGLHRDGWPGKGWAVVPFSPAKVYEAATSIHREANLDEDDYPIAAGVVMDLRTALDYDHDILQPAFDKMWTLGSPIAAWPEALNGYLGVEYWYPRPEEVRAAIIAHVNRQTLSGVTPDNGLRAFEAHVDAHDERLPYDDMDIRFSEQFYSNLVDYLNIEYDYARDPSASQLKRVIDVVERHAALDPDWPEGRTERIVETVNGQGLFVPSTILFGQYVFPYRDIDVPAEHGLAAYSGDPEYDYRRTRTTATFHMGGPIGPLARVDFESVRLNSLRVEMGADGDMQAVYDWTGDGGSAAASPAIIEDRMSAPIVAVHAEGPAENTILRNVGITAMKPPTAAVCGRGTVAAQADGFLDESAWPQSPQIQAFVRLGERAFAAAQTTVYVYRTEEALHVGVRAHEPRMDTMASTAAGRDDTVWDKEAVELRYRAGNDTYRFAVNPEGALFDSRNRAPFWDSQATVGTRAFNDEWVAELVIPFADLGGRPPRGDRWDLNVIRHRYNVVRETSTWAVDERIFGAESAEGVIVFN